MPLDLCTPGNRDLLERNICLSALSKNLKGELKPLHHALERCAKLKCRTLKTIHFLELRVTTNAPCDSPPGRLLDDHRVRKRRRDATGHPRGRLPLEGKGSGCGRVDLGNHQRRYPPPAGLRQLPDLRRERLDGGPLLRDDSRIPTAAAPGLPGDRDVPVPLRPDEDRRRTRRDQRDARGRDRLRLPGLSTGSPAPRRPASRGPSLIPGRCRDGSRAGPCAPSGRARFSASALCRSGAAGPW